MFDPVDVLRLADRELEYQIFSLNKQRDELLRDYEEREKFHLSAVLPE